MAAGLVRRCQPASCGLSLGLSSARRLSGSSVCEHEEAAAYLVGDTLLCPVPRSAAVTATGKLLCSAT